MNLAEKDNRMKFRLKQAAWFPPVFAVLFFLIGGWCFSEWRDAASRFCSRILLFMDETPEYTRSDNPVQPKKNEAKGPETKWKGNAKPNRQAGKVIPDQTPFTGPPVLPEAADTRSLFLSDSCLQAWAVRGPGETASWKNVFFTALNGDVELLKVFPELAKEGGTVLLRVKLRTAEPRTNLFFLFSFDGNLRITLNGKEIYASRSPASFRRNSPFSVITDLPAGENEITLESSAPPSRSRSLNFRLADAENDPLYFEQNFR